MTTIVIRCHMCVSCCYNGRSLLYHCFPHHMILSVCHNETRSIITTTNGCYMINPNTKRLFAPQAAIVAKVTVCECPLL